MLEGIAEGLSALSTWSGLVAVLLGVAIGTVFAILPGIGIVLPMALILPLTFGMDRVEAMMMLVALMGAAGFAGSITAILFNVPGDAVNAASCLDGYPLARQGKAGVAIGASATASGLGALIGIGVLILLLPVVRTLVLAFGPPEFFALTVMGVTMIATVSTRSPLRGAVSGLVGMTLGLVGSSLITPFPRYTFGVLELADGIRLVPALVGLFAIPELFYLGHRQQPISDAPAFIRGGVWEGVKEVLRRPLLLVRSSLLGTWIGVLPGVGAAVATWVAYFAAARWSKDPDSFGSGNIEGVIGPEAAIDAKEGGSLLPVLAFGIPGSVTTAILLSAFLIHGIQPGQRLLQNDMGLVWAMILALIVTNVSTSVLGLLFAGPMARVTLIPIVRIAPVILVLAIIAGYGDRQSLFGVWVTLAFGAIGIVFRRFGYPVAPLIVGLILLPLAERYFHLSVVTHRGSYSFLARPITMVILLLTVLSVGWPSLRRWAGRLRRGGEAPARAPVEAGPPAEAGAAQPKPSRWPELAFVLVLLGGAVALLLDTAGYVPQARLFPYLVIPALIVLLAVAAARIAVGATAGPREEVEGSPGEVVGWMVSLPVLIYLVGIVAAPGLYLVAFWLVHAGRRARDVVVAVVGGLAVSLSIHYLMGELLGVRLFPGILGLG